MPLGAYRFDRVRVLLSEPASTFNGAVRSVLHGLGFRNFQNFETVAGLREQLNASAFDLWVTNARLPDGDVFDLVNDMRHGRAGRDVFLPVIVQSPNVTQALAKKTLDCGADLLWRLPVTGGQIGDGIDNLLHRRRPFVVTADYIGPDRRAGARGEGEQVPVPNPLRSKAQADGFRVDAEDAMRQINQQKVERVIHRIGWLMDRIGPVLTADSGNAEALQLLDRLVFLAQDLAQRLPLTRFHERAEPCRALLLQARKATEEKDPGHIDLLARLVQAERRAFGGETGAGDPPAAAR